MTRTLIVLFICIVMMFGAFPDMDQRDTADAFTLEWFKGGAPSRTVTFNAPGTDTTTVELEIAHNSTVDNATMWVSAEPQNSDNYPLNVTVNVGDDDDVEWMFGGKGYGYMGKQVLFSDGIPNKGVVLVGDELSNNSLSIRLPKGATVTGADMDIRGVPGSLIVLLSNGATLNTYEQEFVNWMNSQAKSNKWIVLAKPYTGASSDFTDALHVVAPASSSAPMNTAQDTFKSNVFDQGRSLAVMGQYAKYLVDNLALAEDARHGYGGFKWMYVNGDDHAGITTGYTGNVTFYTGGNSNGATVKYNANLTGHHLAASYWTYRDTQTIFAVWDSTDSYNGYDYTGTIGGKAIYWGHTLTGGTYTAAWDTFMGRAYDWATQAPITPADVTVNIGDDGGTPEFTHTGELRSEVHMSGSPFINSLNTHLAAGAISSTDKYGNQMVDIPVEFASSQDGYITIQNLSITYDYEAKIDIKDDGDLASELNEHIPADATENVTIPVAVRSESAGKVVLSGLNITYNAAPWFRSDLPTVLECHEDVAAPHILDLSMYAFDDIDDALEMKYEVAKNSHNGTIGVSISDDHWLDVDPSITRNWNSQEAVHGIVEVVVRLTDSGGRSILSPTIIIGVLPENDEPVANESISDIVLLEEEKDNSIILSSKPYFSDIEEDTLFYSVRVDPNDAIEGEEGNLTAEINPITKILTIESHEDYYTGEDVNVPVWIFCDDDENPINDIDSGHLPDGKPNWTYQEMNVSVLNVNDEPFWDDIPDLVTDEDVAVSDVFKLSDYVTDIDSLPETWDFRIRSNSNKRFDVTIDPDTSYVSMTPAENAHGTGSVEVEISDGLEKGKTTFKVRVAPVNDIPWLTVATHSEGSILIGNVTFAGTTDDVEKTVELVEFSVAGSDSWMPLEGTGAWSHVFNTNLYPNGPIQLVYRCFDGELHSANVTLNLTIQNPFNERPMALITSPLPMEYVAPGMMTVYGTSMDPDGVVENVKVMLGGTGDWFVATGTGEGWDSWSYTFNNTQWAGGNVTVSARAYDGARFSLPFNITFNVDEMEDVEGEGEENRNPSKKQSETDLTWVWALVAAIAIVLVLVLLMVIKRKERKELEREKEQEERERQEQEEKEAEERARKASALQSQLQLATPAARAAYPIPTTATGPAPPPAQTFPAPAYGAQPEAAQSLYGQSGGDMYAAQLPPMPVPGGGEEIQLLPPAPPSAYSTPPAPAYPAADVAASPMPQFVGAAAPMAAAPPATQALTQVACYNCGGMVPITSTMRPLSITCPTCGTQGEI